MTNLRNSELGHLLAAYPRARLSLDLVSRARRACVQHVKMALLAGFYNKTMLLLVTCLCIYVN